jgi:ABC-2 type transport system permease protein
MNILIAFFKKELIQTFRDRRFRFFLFVAPIVQVVVFGYVVTTEIKNVSLAVVDNDQSQESRELIDSFFSSGYFKRSTVRIPGAQTESVFEERRLKTMLVIPLGFVEHLARFEPAPVQLLIDGTDANAATVIKGYAEQIFYAFAQNVIAHRYSGAILSNGAPLEARITPEIRIFYNQEMKSSHYMVPGVIVIILLNLTALLTGVAITREKELGTLEQIIVSPVSRWQYILGKTLPYVMIGMINVVLVLGVGKLLFDIPIRGNIVLLFVTSIIFLFTTLGLGLLAASVSENQSQVMLTIFPLLMPAFLLSGLVFPVASIPAALRWIAYINPITYYLTIVRGILIKGIGIAELYREILILAGFGIFFAWFSILRFKKRLG